MTGCLVAKKHESTRILEFVIKEIIFQVLSHFPDFQSWNFFSFWFQHFKYVCHLKETVGVVLNDLPDVESQSGVSNVQQYPLSLCLIKYNRLIISFL